MKPIVIAILSCLISAASITISIVSITKKPVHHYQYTLQVHGSDSAIVDTSTGQAPRYSVGDSVTKVIALPGRDTAVVGFEIITATVTKIEKE